MAILEREIEAYLFNRVKKYGGICIKQESGGGWPDRLVLLPNSIMFFAELKKPKTGKLSELQKERIRRLRKLGYTVYVPDSKEDIDKILEIEHV